MLKKITMIKKINFTAAFLLACALGQAQITEWAGKFGGNGEDVAISIHADAEGNTYSTGFFTLDSDFKRNNNMGPSKKPIPWPNRMPMPPTRRDLCR